jgi:hypothetical protein
MLKKITRLFWREPDFIIGGAAKPYMRRWFVIPRNHLFNIYLHNIVRDDDDRALHDHPWWFLSVMLRGSYVEWLSGGNANLRRAPSVAFRRATTSHRVTLPKDWDGLPIPCWTLVFTGPRVRSWGFQCPQGWRHWRDFTAGKDGVEIGKGCN